jgi:uncharacterized protein YcbX
VRGDDAASRDRRQDLDTLRLIKDYRGVRDGKYVDFGVFGDVERPGRVRVGDSVLPLASD